MAERIRDHGRSPGIAHVSRPLEVIMRQRLGVFSFLASLALPTAASLVAAQATQPGAAPAQPSAPPSTTAAAPPSAAAPAAPVNPGALQPSAAAAAPPHNNNEQSDTFNLTEALRGGQPMSSVEAAKRAVKSAPSLARVEATAQRAEAAAAQANVAVYPRLDLEARYTRVSHVDSPEAFTQLFGVLDRIAAQVGVQGTGGASIKFQDNQGLFQARLSWPVSTLFFSIIPRHDALVKAAESQRMQTFVERQTVALRTREAYYNYARARAALMVAKATLAQAEAHRKDSDALVAAGSIARVELMRAEAQVASAKVAQARAENAVAIARSALYTLIHIDGDEDITISENLEDELPMGKDDEAAIYKQALARRSELRALRKLAESQQRTLAAARGQMLPVLALGGTAEESNPNQRYFGSYEEWKGSWQAYASLAWSPNDVFTTNSVLDQTKADVAGTEADLRSLQDALRVEVSQAYNGFASAHVALDAARVGIAAAEESYRVRREQFRAGAAIAVDVLDAEAQLRQARLDLVNTLIDLRVAKARMDRAVEAE
jgi:outer membrane protein TolC